MPAICETAEHVNFVGTKQFIMATIKMSEENKYYLLVTYFSNLSLDIPPCKNALYKKNTFENRVSTGMHTPQIRFTYLIFVK